MRRSSAGQDTIAVWLIAAPMVLVAATWQWPVAARAETLLLTTGGRIEGEILNRDEVPRQTYVVRTDSGMEIVLPRSAVKKVEHQRPEKLQYERIRPRYPDTVEGHWKLAQWCREHNLLAEREKHLRRILQLDPNHAEARRLLGYARQGDQWTSHEEKMRADGYVLYKGKWMLPQRVRLLEEQKKIANYQGEWKRKLHQWDRWLESNKAPMARENIRRIDDPFAVKALVDAIKDEPRDWVRLLYIEALARIDTTPAVRALAECAMKDPVAEIRLSCLDYLKAKANPAVIDYFVARLYSKDNVEINRAAVALGHLGDKSAIGALIDRLVTSHKYKIELGGPGQMSAGFSPNGPTGLSMGNKTRIVTQQVKNRAVLDALVKLAEGVNFGFDAARWRAWYAARSQAGAVNFRRD